MAEDINQRAKNLGINYEKLQSLGDNAEFLEKVDDYIKDRSVSGLAGILVNAVCTDNANHKERRNLYNTINRNINKFDRFCRNQDNQAKNTMKRDCNDKGIYDYDEIDNYISKNFKRQFSFENFKENVIDEMQSEAFINSLTNASKESKNDLAEEQVNTPPKDNATEKKVDFGIREEDQKDINLLYKLLAAVVKTITFGAIDITPKINVINIDTKEYNPHQPSNVVGRTEEITTTMKTPEKKDKRAKVPLQRFPDPDPEFKEPDKAPLASSVENISDTNNSFTKNIKSTTPIKSILKKSEGVEKHPGFAENIKNESDKNTGVSR